MAAGLGFKTFTTGEVLTAGDVNGYLMQGINVFADAAARTAAITSPQEGQYSYLKDSNSLWYYSGSAWVAAGGSPLTTKGDLYGYSTTDTRVPVGANNTVLTADSAEASGVKWAAPAASGTPPQLTSSITNWYLKAFGLAANTGQTFSDELTYYCPIILGAYTYDRLTIRTSSSHSTAGQEVRLGIYNNDPATNKPSTVLLDAGRITITADNVTNFEITISQTITTAGLYWLAFNQQVSVGVGGDYQGCAAGAVSNNNGLLNTNLSTNTSTNPLIAFSQAGVSGAFATAGTLSNVIGNAKVPQVWIRKN
jgi:hypothetical protein